MSAPAETFRRADGEPNRGRPGRTNAVQHLDGRLKDLLAGKKILMTGVTGFIGEQLLWKILTELPGHQGGRAGPPQALGRRLGADASGSSRRTSSPTVRRGRRRTRAAARGPGRRDRGRPAERPQAARDIDIVVHCAGDVSFDPPIDQAFTTNVIGTKALMDRMIEACSDDDGNLVKIPHYVHISTAYTAGRRRGAIPEAHQVHTDRLRRRDRGRAGDAGPAGHRVADVGPADEVAQGGRARASPGRLPDDGGRHRAPPTGVGRRRAGQGRHRTRPVARLDRRLHLHQGARRAGRRRRRCATSRSRSCGRRSSSRRGSTPIPGWIEGFKMAEPLILAYGRGELPGVPGESGLGGRHRPVRLRGQRDPGGLRDHAGDR